MEMQAWRLEADSRTYLMVRLGSLALVCNVPQEVNRIVIEVVGYRERMQCMCFGKKKEMFDVKEQ